MGNRQPEHLVRAAVVALKDEVATKAWRDIADAAERQLLNP